MVMSDMVGPEGPTKVKKNKHFRRLTARKPAVECLTFLKSIV